MYHWGAMFFIVFQLENIVGCTIIIEYRNNKDYYT
jgi:hypothetical protein